MLALMLERAVGEYKNGRWQPTFGDEQFGVSGRSGAFEPLGLNNRAVYSQNQLDKLLREQRQMCADAAEKAAHSGDFYFSTEEYIRNACLNATGESDDEQ